MSESAGGVWPAGVVWWGLKYSDKFRYRLEGFPNSGRHSMFSTYSMHEGIKCKYSCMMDV